MLTFILTWRLLLGVFGTIWLQYVVFQPTKELCVGNQLQAPLSLAHRANIDIGVS